MIEKCAECGNTLRSQVAWKSEVPTGMVEHFTPEKLASFIDALDEAVQAIAIEFEVGQ